MEAICKPDFDKRVKAYLDAKTLAEAQKKLKKSDQRFITVPEIGFHEIYGVWFFGQLKNDILNKGIECFGVDLKKTMHVFVDTEPKKIEEGIHDIAAYGHSCRLYKWMAQGYHRGLVVLANDEVGNRNAEIYRQSGTWSWIL